MTDLRTDRLLMRQWRDEDLAPFAALNADAEVMRHFPAPMERAASDELAARARAHVAEHGWGLWAVEVVDSATARPDRRAAPAGFIGFVGLAEPHFQAHFTPAVEVGWRLTRTAWGHGYASEAARAAVTYGFTELGLAEIVSFTTVANDRSRRVMERLGMTRDPADDFDHPNLPGSPIAPHVLYRLPRP